MVRRKLRPSRGNGASTYAPQITPEREPVGRVLRGKVEPKSSSDTEPLTPEEPVGRVLRRKVEPKSSSDTEPLTPEEPVGRVLRRKVESKSSSDTEPLTPEERFTRSSKKLESKKVPTPLTKRLRSVKPGFGALKEIHYYQKTTHLLIPRSPFVRLVQEILFITARGSGVERIQRSAVEALQESVEMVLVQFFEDSMLCAVHAKRQTLMQADVRLIRRLKGI